MSDAFDLKYYLKSRLFEDPDCDYRKLLESAYHEYFGKAGQAVFEARQRIFSAAEARGRLYWFPQRNQFNFILGEDIAYVREKFAAAEAKAKDDPRVLRRLAKFRRGFDKLAAWRDGALVRRYPNDGEAVPVPPGLEGQVFWDIPPAKFALYDKKGMKLVDDVRAPYRQAVELNAGVKGLGFPLLAAYYDADNKKTPFQTRIRPAADVGTDYHWYEIGPFPMAPNGYFYFGDSWTVQVHPIVPDFAGKLCRLKVLAAKTAEGGVRLARASLYIERTTPVKELQTKK